MSNLFKIEGKDKIYNIIVSEQYQVAVNKEVLEKIKTILSNLKYSLLNGKQYCSFVSLGYCQNTYTVTFECSNIEVEPGKFQAYLQIRLSPIINVDDKIKNITLSQHDIYIGILDSLIAEINSIKED